MMKLTRRDFFTGAMATAATATLTNSLGGPTDGKDPNFSVFLSDIHVSGPNVKGQPTYQNPLFHKTVNAILNMRPLPARVVVFGDIALWVGRHEDYEESRTDFQRIKDAGIDLYLTMGNHDHRKVFLNYYPEYAKTSPVPGRIVSIIDLGQSDLILLDTLKESGENEGDKNAVEGCLDDAQWNWLLTESQRRKRPFFVGSHHDPKDLGGRKMQWRMSTAKNFVGYIHGHHHKWMSDWFACDWQNTHVYRVAGLPSTGWWGDIGYAEFRTYPDRAELSLSKDNDFFFPKPLPANEKRPANWEMIRSAHHGQSVIFPYRG